MVGGGVRVALAVVLAGMIAGNGPAAAAPLSVAWSDSGFDLPESISYDVVADAFYVTNLGTDPITKDGNGFISKLAGDGTIVSLKWVTGLNAPKSSEIVDRKLYVTDIDELVEIDLTAGRVANRYPVPGARFLNDIAVAPDGRIFIADTARDAIYLFRNGKAEEWVRDARLDGPNGLVIENGSLIVASLGELTGGTDIKPANVKKIDLVTREISDFDGPAILGNLDGIEDDRHGGVIVTDNPKGVVYDVKPGAPPVEVGTVKPGAADLEYVPSRALLIIPEMSDSTVVAYYWRP